MYPLKYFTIAGTGIAPTALMICGPPCFFIGETGHVADEISGFLLGENNTGGVLWLALEQRIVLVDPYVLELLEPRRDGIGRGVVQEADREDQVVARRRGREQVREPLRLRLGHVDPRLDAELPADGKRPSLASWLNERS